MINDKFSIDMDKISLVDRVRVCDYMSIYMQVRKYMCHQQKQHWYELAQPLSLVSNNWSSIASINNLL